MNGNIKIRHIYKAEELKRFAKLEGKYHHMGETHSGGDTMRIVFEDGNGKWLALMVWGSACYHLRPRDEYIGYSRRREPCPAGSRSTGSSSRR